MKATLEFDLPDERPEFTMALRGRWYLAPGQWWGHA
jgi:hypothetical protein